MTERSVNRLIEQGDLHDAKLSANRAAVMADSLNSPNTDRAGMRVDEASAGVSCYSRAAVRVMTEGARVQICRRNSLVQSHAGETGGFRASGHPDCESEQRGRTRSRAAPIDYREIVP